MGFDKKESEELMVATGRMCCLCKTRHRVQLHHIVPREKGGSDDIDNAIPLCPNCHDEVHTSYSPGRVSRTYSERELKLHRQHTIELASRLPELEQGGPARDEDAELISFYGQCLDRPAFRSMFHMEHSYSDFDRAMEDTLLALNTGYWRTRDGAVIDRAKGKIHVVDPDWRERLDKIAQIIEEIRGRFQRELGLQGMLFNFIARPGDRIRDLDEIERHFRHDGELARWMDAKRQEVIDLFNPMLEQIGKKSLAGIRV